MPNPAAESEAVRDHRERGRSRLGRPGRARRSRGDRAAAAMRTRALDITRETARSLRCFPVPDRGRRRRVRLVADSRPDDDAQHHHRRRHAEHRLPGLDVHRGLRRLRSGDGVHLQAEVAPFLAPLYARRSRASSWARSRRRSRAGGTASCSRRSSPPSACSSQRCAVRVRHREGHASRFQMVVIGAHRRASSFVLRLTVAVAVRRRRLVLERPSPLGIGISVVDLHRGLAEPVPRLRVHRQASKQGAPKYMEWYGAFGIMVTLVWLYLEILRLLAKLRS